MTRFLSFTFGVVCLLLEPSTDAQTRHQFSIGGGQIEVGFDSVPPALLQERVIDWITSAAQAVTTYYQRYPVARVEIRVHLQNGRGVNSGRAFGSEPPHITIAVGRATTATDFGDDWVITHEMVHLAFPSVSEQHHWIEEGLATYIEPIARARAGSLTAQKVWGDMMDSMPKGMPKPGDHGLDFTHTWGRTYWGGALFCLLADVEIHRRTGNHKGLEDAMRGILKSGGSIQSEWPLERALETADRAAGVSVLEELYATMKAAPVTPDLNTLWEQLGVERSREGLTFNDSAPLAAIRDAITERVGHHD